MSGFLVDGDALVKEVRRLTADLGDDVTDKLLGSNATRLHKP